MNHTTGSEELPKGKRRRKFINTFETLLVRRREGATFNSLPQSTKPGVLGPHYVAPKKKSWINSSMKPLDSFTTFDSHAQSIFPTASPFSTRSSIIISSEHVSGNSRRLDGLGCRSSTEYGAARLWAGISTTVMPIWMSRIRLFMI